MRGWFGDRIKWQRWNHGYSKGWALYVWRITLSYTSTKGKKRFPWNC